GAISIGFRLGLERTIALSSLRMVVQLSLVALALKVIFDLQSPLWTGVFVLFMTGAATYEILSRQERKVAGPATLILGAGAPFFAGLIATMFAAVVVIGPEPWYAPRYFLPIFGMMLGNALSGTSLVLNT